MIVIELHDAGIAAFDESGLVLPPDPGYALIEGDELSTGQAALARSRLKPRRVNHRFWDELDTTPLSRPFPPGLSRGDLAHAQLSRLWSTILRRPAERHSEQVILVVPGSFSPDQLSLLLGIAQACEMPTVGMVDAAVAASTRGYPGPRLLHLDLLLHRVVLSEMLQEDGTISRRWVETVDGAGQVELMDLWAKQIADVFIHQTRFDPLHAAATEQALYDRLPEWLARLRRAESTVLVMEAGGKEKSAELGRAELVAAAERPYRAVLALVGALAQDGPAPTLLLSHRFGRLPGLEQQLVKAVGTAIVTLPAGAAAAGTLEHHRLIAAPAEEVPFVTRLPVTSEVERDPSAAAERVESSPPEPAGRRPTHVVHEGVAYPITEQLLALGTEAPEGGRALKLPGSTDGVSAAHCSIFLSEGRAVVEDHSACGSFVNGERVDGTATLEAGDRLQLGRPGIELQLIAIEDDDAPA